MKTFDVVGIGNPLLDIVVRVDDAFLSQLGLERGGMFLVSQDESGRILKQLSGTERIIGPGGGAANAISGIASLGGQAAFMGMVGQDTHSQLYKEHISEGGVHERLSYDSLPTGYAITLITPDGERTFAVYLGAALQFRAQHVDEDSIIKSKYLHIEGYQLEGEQLFAAEKAMAIAKEHGTLVSLDLADAHLIGRAKNDMSRLITEYVDVLFANEEEAQAYTGLQGEQALRALAKDCSVVALKQGARGSLIWHKEEIAVVPAQKVRVENTNGAGDAFAAGMLYGLAKGLSAQESAQIGTAVAAEVVQSVLARTDKDLSSLSKRI